MAVRLDGKSLARDIRRFLSARVAELHAPPGLLLIRVGDDPASEVYVGTKQKMSAKVGIESSVEVYPEDTSESALLARIAEANLDPKIHGILVQLPLPKQIDPDRVAAAVDPTKDVDALHPVNIGHLAQGQPTFVSCTPLGVLALLRKHEVELSGRHVVVLGRSNIVGRPLSLLLGLKAPWANATVTVVHSRSRDWEALTRQADIVVAAMGRPEAIRAEHVKPGAAVVDVGIHRVAGGGPDGSPDGKDRLVGDVHAESVEPLAGHLSPVPGGVGPLTVAMLLSNTVHAAERVTGRDGGSVELALQAAGVLS